MRKLSGIKGRAVSLVLVGMLFGTVMITPVSAHFKESTLHLAKHAWGQYIRGQADARYVSNTQSIQEPCSDGSVLGYATVAGSGVFSSAFTTTGVNGFSCAAGEGEVVQAKRAFNAGTNDATYTVDFPGLTFSSTLNSNVQITTVGGSGQVAGVYGASSGDVTAQLFQDVTGDAIDIAFSITVFKAG